MGENYKKYLAQFAFSLILVLGLIALDFSQSYAAKTPRKKQMLAGLNKINYEASLLKEAKIEKYKKFEADLADFKDKGSSKIKSSNMFYVLNNNEFSAKEYDAGLANTNLAGLGKDFKAAEEKYGVNAILLMAMAKHETGNGTSELFRNKNNLFGFNAYDHDPYNQASHFNTPGESINTVAEHLAKNYLDPEGPYYNGLSTDAIGISYATDPDWSKKVDWMMIEVGQNMIDAFNNEAGK